MNFRYAKRRLYTEGYPVLRKDSIGFCAEKGFDLEILLDPFEEQFDFPSLLAHLGDCDAFEIKGIGEKRILPARFLCPS